MSGLTAAAARQIVSEASDRYGNDPETHQIILAGHASRHGLTVAELLDLGAPDKDAERAAALAQANHMLGLTGDERIVEWRRYMSEPPTFEVVGTAGKHKITVAGAAEFRTVKVAILSACDAVPELAVGSDGKKVKWDRVLKSLKAAQVRVDVGEVTDDSNVQGWIEAYLQAHVVLDQQEEGSDYPFAKDGRVVVFANAMREWLWLSKRRDVAPKDFAAMMRSYGCEYVQIKVTSATTGRPSTASGWVLPEARA